MTFYLFLILTALGRNPSSDITTLGPFFSEEECRAAGSKIERDLRYNGSVPNAIKYTCISLPRGR